MHYFIVIRELTKQFNEVKGAAEWTPVASKVSATKQAGGATENQSIMAWRLGRQCLHRRRLDTTNMQAYEASIEDEAIWTKRAGMEITLRVNRLPEDREEAEAAIKAGGNWFVVCPNTVGSRDKFGGARPGGQDEEARGPQGKGKKASETPLKHPKEGPCLIAGS